MKSKINNSPQQLPLFEESSSISKHNSSSYLSQIGNCQVSYIDSCSLLTNAIGFIKSYQKLFQKILN